MNTVYIMTKDVYSMFDILDWFKDTLGSDRCRWQPVRGTSENILEFTIHKPRDYTLFTLVWGGSDKIAILTGEEVDILIQEETADF